MSLKNKHLSIYQRKNTSYSWKTPAQEIETQIISPNPSRVIRDTGQWRRERSLRKSVHPVSCRPRGAALLVASRGRAGLGAHAFAGSGSCPWGCGARCPRSGRACRTCLPRGAPTPRTPGHRAAGSRGCLCTRWHLLVIGIVEVFIKYKFLNFFYLHSKSMLIVKK